MMADARKARLDVIDDSLGFDEFVLLDVLALLFEPGGQLKKREAEGYLVLTNRRLIFGTVRHGILVDVSIKEVVAPVAITHKIMMARLLVTTVHGAQHTLVVNKSAAQRAALAINAAVTD